MPILARSSSSSDVLGARASGPLMSGPEVRAPRNVHKEPFMAKSINHLAAADNLFFGKGSKGGALDRRKTEKMVDDALAGCDDGELFLEYEQSESLSFDDGKLKSASYDTT